MKKIHFLLLFITFISLPVQSQVISVGLFSNITLKKAILIANNGGFEIYGDGNKISDFYKNDGIRLEIINRKISVRTLSDNFGSYTRIEIRNLTQNGTLKIKGLSPKTAENPYNDNFIVEIRSNGMQILNLVNIEKYVAGVVEAESGKDRPMEYYKVQSIISRTYALANIRRHADEGFQLCDQVHCQVYNGKSRFVPIIKQAVAATRGIVMVDSDINLASAAFSSNCGGKTRNSEDVWSKKLSYLKTVTDTFCLQSEHTAWKKSIDLSTWKSYKKKHALDNTHAIQAGMGASIDNTYSEFIYNKRNLLSIRYYFKLNSTRFVIEEKKDSVLFIGRGFGHGVGLCQEGAIRMAEIGYSYKQVLEFYYTDIHLIELKNLDFFKQN